MSDDLVIIVPGITGSVLAREGKPLWSLSAAALRGGLVRTTEVLNALTLPSVLDCVSDYDQHALETPELIRGLHVWPGFWKGSGYGQLIERVNTEAPGRVLCFPYDWRLPNAHSATRLQRFVDEALKDGQGQRVTFVCHSMGGLIARYYLEVLGGREHAARLITIGTPFSGSVKAVKALTGGLVPHLPGIDERLVRVAKTFPSVAELLPTYRCVDVGDGGEPVFLDEIDVPGLAKDLVQRGRSFHDELREAVIRNNRAAGGREPTYALHVYAGKMQVTDQSIAIDKDRIVYRCTQRGVDHHGDGTVARFGAMPPEWTHDENARFRAAKHGPLAKHSDLLDDVIDQINSRDLGSILAPPDELSLEVPDVASASEPISVTVTSTSPNLRLHASVRDADDTVYDGHIPVRPDTSGRRYETSLQLPAGLWQVRVEEITQHPSAFIEDLITVA
ncbi:hypothetical protein ACIHDR_23665 [Nocardia sp. NPDC052278]|uniref:lipase/acyltransferase domain-containing protein n=1 Tax=unclassified Nocardia TaxID=2637762 RepID=UPI003695249B